MKATLAVCTLVLTFVFAAPGVEALLNPYFQSVAREGAQEFLSKDKSATQAEFHLRRSLPGTFSLFRIDQKEAEGRSTNTNGYEVLDTKDLKKEGDCSPGSTVTVYLRETPAQAGEKINQWLHAICRKPE